MEKLTNKMDSVFDDVADSVTDFDVMFDDDDHLVDVVEGFASNGKPLTGDEFEDIHLSDDEKGDPDSTFDLDDDCDPNDIKDALTGDELMGASIKDIENGSEWDIDNNNKYFKSEQKDAGEKWFEDSDKEYQKSDFHGSVDPENINKSLEAQREAAAFLESDEEEPEDLESEDESFSFLETDTEDKKDKEDLESEDESFDFFSEDTVHDDIDSTTDIMDKNPKDEFDIEDEDDAESRKDDDAIGDGVGELKEFGSFLESDEDEDLESEDESFSFLENDEGILADNDEADVHSDVQCDGTESCKCPMCREKKLNDTELAVGDTFAQEAAAFLDAPDVTDPVMEAATDDKVPSEDFDFEDEAADLDSETDTTEESAEFDLDSDDEAQEECGDTAKNFNDWTDESAFLEDTEEDLVDPDEDMEDIAVDLADDDTI